MKKELKSEFNTRQYMLSKDFEIYYYSDSKLPDVHMHSHDYFEFYFFIEGHVIMHIDDIEFTPSPGTLVIIRPGISHFVRLLDGQLPYRRFVFWLAEIFLNRLSVLSSDYKYLTDLSEKNRFFIYKFTDIEFNTIQGKVFTLIDELHSERFGREAKLMLSAGDLILSINRIVYKSLNPPKKLSENASLYESIIQYIENHIDEPLTLDLLSDKLHVSKYHISHVFTKLNGMPLHKYITKKRLDMCRDACLSGKDMTLVAETYGFSDYSAFYRAFVKEYGKSPKKYRDEIMRNV